MSGVSHIVSARSAEGAGFLNKYLEIRENRVNTHTHTHTGLARQYTANHLIHKGLAAVFLQLSALLFRENHIMHTVSPPCGNALAETFIYPRNRVHAATRWRRLSYIPGTVSRTSMLCPQVSGAFCIQQQTDKPNMNI